MAFEVEGKLFKKFDTEKKSDKFQARDFVLEVPSQYPQKIKFQLVQDRCEIIDHFEEGQDVKVYFDLRGREWEGRFFTNLNAWKIEKAGAHTAAPATGGDDFPSLKDEPSTEGQDDLPF